MNILFKKFIGFFNFLETKIIRLKQIDKASKRNKDMFLGSQLLDASKNGDLFLVEKLISNGADLNYKTEWGGTALYFACWHGHLETVIYLIENGATFDHKNQFGDTPLLMAKLEGHKEIVDYLKSKGAKE